MMAAEALSLATSYYQSGQYAQAEQVLREILRGNAADADAWCLLGVVCRAMGDLDGAAASYREALRLRPSFLEAQNNLANVLVAQGEYAEAVAIYEGILRVRPDAAQTHNNLGAALRQQGRLEEALACYRRALRLDPEFADAHNNLGDVLAAQGQLDDAAACLRQALWLRPNYPEALNNLGAVLSKQKKLEEAIGCYRRSLELRPNQADTRLSLANLLMEQGQFPEAETCLRDAVELRPHWAEAHNNLGNALLEQDRVEEALGSYQRALQLRPDYAEVYDNRAQAYLALGKPEEALAQFEQALRLCPDSPKSHMGVAIALLVLGDYERGWREYEWRWKCEEFPPRNFSQPLWDGSPLDGRTILLHAEQGLGDTLQFVRYATVAKQRGGRVIVACQKQLLGVLGRTPGIDRLVDYAEALPAFDVHAPLLSLPRILGTTVQTIPSPIPYIHPDPELVQRWRSELSAYKGFKIGFAWQGNPRYRADRRRSFPISALAPLASVPGVHLFSLQKGAGAEQIRSLAELPCVVDLGSRLDETAGPFCDTAAVMQSLDLVICPDMSLAHLAGAMGVPVWIALPLVPEWRWLWNRQDSPWYPSARLFRQKRLGDWTELFQRIAAALAERLGAPGRARMITVPVSAGELIDKITILQIKSSRFTDQAKLDNVRKELAELTAVRDQALGPCAQLDELTAELRRVNEALWPVSYTHLTLPTIYSV